MSESELEKVKRLLKDAYGHLNYCGYSDAWERGFSEKLQEDLDSYFFESENEAKGARKG